MTKGDEDGILTELSPRGESGAEKENQGNEKKYLTIEVSAARIAMFRRLGGRECTL